MSSLTWRTIWRRIENLDVEKKFRRASSRRKAAAAVLLFIFIIYMFSSRKSALPQDQNNLGKCTLEKMKFYKNAIDEFDVGLNENSMRFVGNGFFGIDPSGELLVGKWLKEATGLFPALEFEVEGASVEEEEAVVTDFRNGIVKVFKCFQMENSECGCVTSSVFAHRARKEVFVQEISISNPTRSSVRLNLNRKSSNWWANSKIGDITTHQRQLGNTSYVVVCSDSPGKVTVSQKREETLKFHCVITNLQKLEAVQLFKETKERYNYLNLEHEQAWKMENSEAEATFSIQTSKAPNVLNGDRINATRYLLQSHLESHPQPPPKAAGNCYNGHSTLLYPSRLWQSEILSRPISPSKATVTQIVENWRLTLEKQGCTSLLTHSQGITQAFVQSLGAASYNEGHLELGLNSDDLHREMRIGGIPVGGTVGRVTVNVRLDDENRPEFYVSSTNQLFACDGGCLDQPVVLGKSETKIPVKVTKPVTSLLYVATNRKHLEQLKSAIHVAEVQSAPAHQDDVIELHKNGDTSSGSLPTSFWCLLILTLIAFHLILAKLFWNEWRKGDMTPYNPYLRNRYSLRPH